MKVFTKSMLAVISLSTASVYYAQSVKDTANTKEIEQVVLTGVADIAKDRKTPVAVSTIKEAQIIEKLGNQEFPEILNTTPSVYATKSGGGFGDSRITIRGFDQNNIAVLINGVPVNDMENGSVYWSNWAGLSDVTSAMQVQRGLGSSKLAIASVGGTINIFTRAADKKESGRVSVGVGNDGYNKALFSYNSGKNAKGWSTSFLMSRTAGNMYADGTKFEGYNYYFALGYQPSAKHDLQFTITGAPQWHNQRSYSVYISDAIKYGGSEDKPNRRYNSMWGNLNGEEYTFTRNYYHKPIMSLNWDYKISSESKLSTVLYGSWGRGGGTGYLGKVGGKSYYNFRDDNGILDFDAIYAANQAANGAGGDAVLVRRSSVNSHNWFGILSNFQHKINDNWSFSAGIDARTYKGFHYRVVNDLLGANGYIDKSNSNNPINLIDSDKVYQANASWNPFSKVASVSDRIAYSDEGIVNWAGVFGQLEYSNDIISAFVQGSASNQGFKRIDDFIKDGEDGLPKKTDMKNIFGYNLKGGLNINIDEHNNVFANIGYYSKQPGFDAVYLNDTNTLNNDLNNEKIFSVELGYGFRSNRFNANLNLYRTTWKDQYERLSYQSAEGDYYYANLLGLDEIHQGIELDLNYEILEKRLFLNGMLSMNDYHYTGNPSATFIDNDNNNIGSSTLYIDDLKVGNKAQFTSSLGLDFKPVEWFSIDATYRYVDRNYSSFNPSYMTEENGDPAIKLPAFGLFDLGASFKVKLKDPKQYFTLRGNVYNLFDKVYISDSYTNLPASTDPTQNWKGINQKNQVWFGFGRTWSATLSFNF